MDYLLSRNDLLHLLCRNTGIYTGPRATLPPRTHANHNSAALQRFSVAAVL